MHTCQHFCSWLKLLMRSLSVFFAIWWFQFLCWKQIWPLHHLAVYFCQWRSHSPVAQTMNLIREYCFRDLSSILFLSLLHCPHCHWDKSSLQPACHIYIAGCLPAHHTPPSFTSSLHNITGLFFLPTVSLSLDLPQFHICTDATCTCLSSCSLLFCSSAARLDGRKGKIVQAEPIKKGHTNSVWTLMWLHKPFTSVQT